MSGSGKTQPDLHHRRSTTFVGAIHTDFSQWIRHFVSAIGMPLLVKPVDWRYVQKWAKSNW